MAVFVIGDDTLTRAALNDRLNPWVRRSKELGCRYYLFFRAGTEMNSNVNGFLLQMQSFLPVFYPVPRPD
jgi:hypothetical protein